MYLAQQKQFEASMKLAYPQLREPGMYTPAKYGRSVIDYNEFINIFYDKASESRVVEVALYLAGQRLKERLADEKFKDVEPSLIINQHFDLAETYLLHHSKRLPNIYEANIEEFELERGDCLEQAATDSNATPLSWLAYGYWLVGRADKKKAEGDFETSAEHLDKAEKFFRQAHQAQYAEATEALATLLYIERAVGDCPYVEEAIALWEHAARFGNSLALAIQNYYTVSMADDSLDEDERLSGLQAIWQGATSMIPSQRDPAVKEIVRAIKKSGILGTISATRELAC